MASESLQSNQWSLVSLDPTRVARSEQSVEKSKGNSVSSAATDRTRSSKIHSSTSKPKAPSERAKQSRSEAVKGRANSLRKVKNSTEVLRQRAIQEDRTGQNGKGMPDSREGRHFTVGNVGIGGLLYLKPSSTEPLAPWPDRPFVFPLTPPKSAPLTSDNGTREDVTDQDHAWHDRALHNTANLTRSVTTIRKSPRYSIRHSRHGRSYSFSSIDDRMSAVESSPGTLRVVINRSTSTRHQALESFVLPTLEVPIPHYRLGTPRFSSEGTPILRSSTLTRTSLAPSEAHRALSFAQPDLLFPTPPTFKAIALEEPPNATIAVADPASPILHGRRSATMSSASTAPKSSRITPDIFDRLVKVQDHPSVVRYSKKTGDIMAATPVRIVAQISSESFMDYELVSDFFLTFRAYLSTKELLDLLLARLRWSIGRLEEDGRIVRIRTFAALRHWILNYFMDDFVLDRDLRVRFCDQVNEIYREVGSRPKGGASDLKILQDLKRCWNGRCSLYWDSPDFKLDSSLDAEIAAGGVFGNRNSAMITWNDFDLQNPSEGDSALPQPEATQSWFGEPPKQPGPRVSNNEAMIPVHVVSPESPQSEQSVQPNSCSLPMRVLRVQDAGHVDQGPQPVSVQMRRNKAPSNLAVSTGTHHAHKRSASSLDSARQPTPKGIPVDLNTLATVHGGNLIRGQLMSPPSAIVELLPPFSAFKRSSKNELRMLGIEQRKSTSPTSPATKSILGSIRRVLGGKQGSTEVAILSPSDTRHQGTLRGKLLTKSLVSTKSHDELRKIVDSRPVKSQIRVDLLCAAVSHSYNLAVSHNSVSPHEVSSRRLSPTIPNQNPRALSPGHRRKDHKADFSQVVRMHSQVTDQSGSILIVDDTGLDLVAMTGALPPTIPINTSQLGHSASELHDTGLLTSPQPYSNQSPGCKVSQPNPAFSGLEEPLLHDRPEESTDGNPANLQASNVDVVYSDGRIGSQHISQTGSPAMTSTSTSSDTMRKPPSFQSTVDHGQGPASIAATQTSISSHHLDENDDAEQAQSHVLRRRPGGDLKKTQHVHDLEQNGRQQSFDSAVAATDSTGNSLLIMANKPQDSGRIETSADQQKQVSMIKTHSSQHLRPSFEAAVSGFAALPDDDDGGLEATLLKLEGRYEKPSPTLSTESISEQPGKSVPHSADHLWTRQPIPLENGTKISDSSGVSSSPSSQYETVSRLGASNLYRLAPSTAYKHIAKSPASSGSGESHILGPILDRDSTMSTSSHNAQTAVEQSTGKVDLSNRSALGQLQVDADSSHSSLLVVKETWLANRDNPSPDYSGRNPTASVQSFLLDEDENLSDLSSEISVDIINQSDLIDRPFSPIFAAPGTARSGLELPAHPLAHSSASPSLIRPAANTTGSSSQGFPQMPPTPDQSPELPQTNEAWQTRSKGLMPSAIVNQEHFSVPPLANPAHIPFILAFDSQTLAQQFTLVEQSALSEVEWIDLVDMRWENKAANILDWVEYLVMNNTKGIDLVITRFNLIVKWALSQIVLTQDIQERARTITKYIHIAAHCRRLHNYATMLQLTIALTSIDCTRLLKTWDLVSAPDRSLLKNMEALIQPLRNFHDLRAEMESADLSDGCIPFVGLYVHDLTYNAQKPSQVAGTRDSEPLVNFERYRTAAVIVKDLLRLIDASSKYTFHPVEGVIDRCLWMAALSDDQIRAQSKSLEE